MDNSVSMARAAFPAGLTQPEKGFRFGLDSLLLACWAPVKQGDRVLDLGTGCAAVGLGLCLMNMDRDLRVLGVDSDPEMVEAAEKNVRKLGLEHMFEVRMLNVQLIQSVDWIKAGSFDLAVCNPPYRQVNQGRQPRDRGRQRACFEQGTGMGHFMQAAAYAVKNRGRVGLVYLAERLSVLLPALVHCQLEPKHLRLVHPSQKAPANLVLISAMKKGRPGLTVHSPLFLDSSEDVTTLCPLLPA